MEQYKNYINGQFRDSYLKIKFYSTNPTTEEPWAKICCRSELKM